MADKIEKIIADTFLQMAEGLETGSFGKKPRIALTGMGSEHGEKNSMAAAIEAAKEALAGIKDYDDISVMLEDGTVRRCILSHYFIPFYNGHRYNAIHLHGHSHFTAAATEEFLIAKTLNENGYNLQIYNVGCMYWNYAPLTLDEILKTKEQRIDKE